MSNEYGDDIFTIEDEDGNEIQLDAIDQMDYNDSTYGLFLPADMDENDPDYGWVILRIVEENGEEYFEDIDDEDELNEVYEKFMTLLDAEDE